jgi:four helix bundle protein
MGNVQKGYHKLLTWQRSHELVKSVYGITRKFPKEELFGLTSQLRRSTVSVTANIVEGHAKPSNKDFLRYLYNSLGSLTECEYYLELSLSLKYISKEEYNQLEKTRKETAYLLIKFMESIKKKIK